MRANSRAIQSYGDVKVGSGVATANNVQLIQMLFDGLLESLSTARGHIQHKNINEKSKAIARASRIVVGLQGSLDFAKGGELADWCLFYKTINAEIGWVNFEEQCNVVFL